MTYGANPYGAAPWGGIDQQGVPLPPPPPGGGGVLRGVLPTQVGEEYDLAVGFNPGNGTTTMFGYLLEQGSGWSEAPNIQDEQRLVTIASPNTTDRYTSFPKVTQDDWSGGEGQEYFSSSSDPSRYYQSFNVDPTKPGFLSLTPDAITTKVVPTAASHAPVVCDGSNLAVGLIAASPYAVADLAANLYYLNAAGTPEPLFATRDPKGGAFFATTSGTNGGIYRMDNVPSGGIQPTSTLWTTDIVPADATQALAYMSAPAPTGGLYYLRATDNTICTIGSATGGAGSPVYTGLSMEDKLRFLCSTATGLLFATQSTNVEVQAQTFSVLYSFDGVTATRIFDFPGIVRAGFEMNGVTYCLVEYTQPHSMAMQFTMLAYSNGQISVLFDQRYASPDFQSVMSGAAGSPYGCNIDGDGRFLYIGWPGYYPLVYDTERAAFIRSGPAPVASGTVWAHRFFITNAGSVDVVSVGAGGLGITFTQARAGSTAGYLISSWIDAGTPGVAKSFRSIEIELQQPFPLGATVALSYRLDQNIAYTPTSGTVTLPNGNILAILPVGTRGYRIQLNLGLRASGAISPTVRSVALTINPSRVWKLTVACRKLQNKRNGAADSQGDSTTLLANLLLAYDQGGFVTLFVPDPRNPTGTPNPDGSGTAKYVSMTTAKIEDLAWHSTTSPAWRQDVDGSGTSIEGLVDLTLAEQL